MTVLIGASVLLIAGSAIALVFGWAAANESLIWTSIVASAGAAVTLALAFFRSRQEAAAVARRARAAEVSETPAPDIPTEAGAVPETAPAAATPATATTARAKPKATRGRARPTTGSASTRAVAKPARMAEVFGSRDSRRYHRPECRYAASKRAEKMTRSEAEALGYRPCGICKP